MVAKFPVAYFGGRAVPVVVESLGEFVHSKLCQVADDGEKGSSMLKLFLFSLLSSRARDLTRFVVYDGRGDISRALSQADVPYTVLDPFTKSPFFSENESFEDGGRASLASSYSHRSEERAVHWDLMTELRSQDRMWANSWLAHAIFQARVEDTFDKVAEHALLQLLEQGREETSPWNSFESLVALAEDPEGLFKLTSEAFHGSLPLTAYYALGRELRRYVPFSSDWMKGQMGMTIDSFLRSSEILVLRPVPSTLNDGALDHYHRAFFRALCKRVSHQRRKLAEVGYTVFILDEPRALLRNLEPGRQGNSEQSALCDASVPATVITSLSSELMANQEWIGSIFERARYQGSLAISKYPRVQKKVLRAIAERATGYPIGSDNFPGDIGEEFRRMYESTTLRPFDLPTDREDGIEGLFCFDGHPPFLHLATLDEMKSIMR